MANSTSNFTPEGPSIHATGDERGPSTDPRSPYYANPELADEMTVDRSTGKYLPKFRSDVKANHSNIRQFNITEEDAGQLAHFVWEFQSMTSDLLTAIDGLTRDLANASASLHANHSINNLGVCQSTAGTIDRYCALRQAKIDQIRWAAAAAFHGDIEQVQNFVEFAVRT